MIDGEHVKRLRLGLGMTQAELAARAGLDQAQISAIERGRRMPRPGTLRQLAAALEVPIAALLNGQPTGKAALVAA